MMPSSSEIYVASAPVDFRKGIDGLCGVCSRYLNKNPQSGAMFVFSNRSRQALKILIYDRQGYWVYHKRLSRGKFNWWPGGELCTLLAMKELSALIWNGDPSAMQSDWY